MVIQIQKLYSQPQPGNCILQNSLDNSKHVVVEVRIIDVFGFPETSITETLDSMSGNISSQLKSPHVSLV